MLKEDAWTMQETVSSSNLMVPNLPWKKTASILGGASHGNMSLEALSKNRQSWRGIPSPMCFEVWRWPQIPPRRKDSILQTAVLPPFILQELTGKSMPNEAHSMSTHESNVPCSWYLQCNTSAWKKNWYWNKWTHCKTPEQKASIRAHKKCIKICDNNSYSSGFVSLHLKFLWGV